MSKLFLQYRTYLVGAGTVCILAYISLLDYLLFHTLAEFFSIVVAVTIFAFTWNTRQYFRNNYLLLAGLAYLFVGMFDALHSLLFPGMNIVEGSNTNVAAQVWLSARLLEAGSLCAAPFFVRRRLNTGIILLLYPAIGLFLAGSIFTWDLFPVCFIPGQGLTSFKVAAEYFICALLATSLLMLVRLRSDFEADVFRLLAVSIVLTVASEVFLTLYLQAYSITNMAGHVFKILSFYLIYRAIILTGLVRPYTLLDRELQEKQRALEEKEQWYRSIVQDQSDCIFRFRPDGGLTFANHACLRFFGKGPGETATVADSAPDFERSFREISPEITPESPTRHLRHSIGDARGGVRWLSWLIRGIFDQEGRIREYQAVGRDETDVVQAKEEAEMASRAKSRFLANMSHEIRTPLNSATGMVELAMLQTGDPSVRSYLEMAKQSTDNLMDIINDILDLSKIEAGKTELARETFALRELIRTTVQPLALHAEGKGLSLDSDVAATVPDALTGDPGRLRQILTNLIGNAVKFTSEGSIRLSVRDLAQPATDGDQVCLEIEVADTGPGIPRERLEKIFDNFSQGSSSHHARYGGTGLGLSIVKQLVELMDGEIEVSSQEGLGSLFRFTVRLEPGRPEDLASPVPESEPQSDRIRQCSILLAEDDRMSQLFTRRLLEQRGHRVDVAENGREALAKLSSCNFDLVLMDVEMPEMSGEEAVRAIREGRVQGVDAQIPVIALTAHALQGHREQFMHAGMTDYLAKPVSLQDLEGILARLG
jgi:PAS domain S-box-containing protein